MSPTGVDGQPGDDYIHDGWDQAFGISSSTSPEPLPLKEEREKPIEGRMPPASVPP